MFLCIQLEACSQIETLFLAFTLLEEHQSSLKETRDTMKDSTQPTPENLIQKVYFKKMFFTA